MSGKDQDRRSADDSRKLSDLGNELHNLSCHVVHVNEGWAEQIGKIARELWKWPQASAGQSASTSAITGNLRAVLAMVLQALDRDAADGRAARGEMAEELRAAMVTQSAPAGEREALQRLLDDVRDVRNADDIAFGWDEAAEYFGAAWQRTQPGVPECFKQLLHHAHGLTMGVDWNKGTQAGRHREPLGEAVVQCQAWLAAAPAQQPAPDRVGVPVKLLERAALLLQDSINPPDGCSDFDDWAKQGNAIAAELRALLTAQPQASVAQSEHHCSNCLGVQPESCLFAQSAPVVPEPYPHGHPLHKAVFTARESYTGSETFEEGVHGLIAELNEARQGRGEVRRLREALNRIRDHAARVMDDEVFYEVDNALATSAGQEV